MRTTFRRLILGALIVLLAGTLWFGWQAYSVYRGLSNVTGKAQPRLVGEPTVTIPPINGNQRFNILVLGSDNDRKVEERRPLTQSMIVVTVDPIHYQVSMLSIPRDFWVPIKGHGYDKIDTASKYGGISLARQTVEHLFGIPIQFYAWVGLNGLTRVVNTFNGVTIDVSHPILDDFYPADTRPGDPYAFQRVFIPAGWRHLSGRQALEYVRSRHADAIGDFGRSARQQQLLLALRRKADSVSVITDLPALVNDLQNSVQTDFTLPQILDLARLSRHVNTSRIRRVVLQAPTFCNYGMKWQNGAWQSVLIPHWSAIRPVVRSLFASLSRTSGATQHPRSQARSAPTHPRAGVTPAPAPQASPTPPEPRLGALPGTLIYEANGNVFELSPSRQVRQLTTAFGVANADAMPSVSRDGRTIAFVRFSENNASEILTQNIRTGRVQQLTHDADTADIHDNLWAAFPSFSPDGKTLLFSTDRAKLPIPESESRPIDLAIWAMPSGGGNPRQITSPSQGAGGDTDPLWLPGTNRFLYVSWSYNTATSAFVSQLVLRDVADQSAWRLTAATSRVLQPEIDRKGQQVVYVQGNGTGSEIVTASLRQAAGASPRLGPARVLASGEVAQPALTPDGRWVSFLRANGDGFSLEMVPVTGGTPVRINEVGSNMDSLSRPVWAP